MSVDGTPSSPTPLKRKRQEAEDDLEIDLSLPEPLSKKDLRKAKKRKEKPVSTTGAETTDNAADAEAGPENAKADEGDRQQKENKRSEFGIWIGNLPWSVTKLDIRKFLCSEGESIEDSDITRVHMPAPASSKGSNGTTSAATQKPKNKGFAYVDFTTAEVLAKALELSEKLLLGRRVLIKNATNFEGRPAVDPAAGTAALEQAGKPASRRVFVGNLSFSVDEPQLKKHFSQCGEVADVHVATFEDSGKCKGYAWVTFETLEAATAAVRGFILLDDDNSNSKDSDAAAAEDGAEGKRRPLVRALRQRRKRVDKIEGRVMRREFAEDKAVRYNKRFGKGAKRDEQTQQADATTDGNGEPAVPASKGDASASTAHSRRREKRLADKLASSEKVKQRYIPHDTRPRPGKATGSIPADRVAVGTKVSFD